MFALFLTAALLPPALAAQAEEGAGARGDAPGIVGVIVDRETLQPIEAASVILRPADGGVDAAPAPVLTDASGRFLFAGLGDGEYTIEIERIGYESLESSIVYRAALGLRVDAQLVNEAVELEPLLVVADARSHNLAANGFYDRRRGGMGRFVTRDEIASRNAFQLTDVLRTMPGVQIRPSRVGAGVVLLRGGCIADVYVDGVRTVSPFPVDDVLQAGDVEGLEVYHASEVPARFGTTTCGAVMIWTYTPNPGTRGNPFTLGRALAAVGFVALALFFTR